MTLEEVVRQVYDLFNGSTVAAGDVTLGVAPDTTTTVTHRGVSTNSVVHLMATNAAAATEGVGLLITPTKGQFVITHSSSAGSRTYRYHFHTPRRPL